MRRLILALAVSLAFAAPASADELSELLDRYRAWRGGPAFEAMHALLQEGAISTAGLNGTVRVLATDTPALRQDVDLGTFRNAQAWSAGTGWQLTTSGQVEDLSDHASLDLQRDALLQFERLLDDPARLTLREPVTVDGQTLAVVHVAFGGADVHELRFAPATGELRGLRTVRDRRESMTRFEDWRVVEGVRLPFRAVTRDDTGRDTVVRLSTADVNPPVPADAFARPQARFVHAIAGGARATRPIPIDLYAGVRIFVPATVQGRQTPALLDSGAEMTILDRGFAQSLGLTLEGDLPAVGTGGVSTAQLARGVTLQVGDLTLRDMTVGVIDMEIIGKQLGRPLPVVLGKDAFNALAIDIDLPRRQLVFHEAEGFVPPAGAVEVPLAQTPHGRAVEVCVEGGEPVLFDFDTGNGGSLLIYPSYWQAQGLAENRPSSTVMSGAVGGVKESVIVSLKRFTFAGVEMADVPAVLTPPGPSAVDGERTRGNIGMSVLGRFRIISDFATDRLYLIADPVRMAEPFAKDRLGLGLARGDGVVEVRRVSPGSPAAKAGWTAGARIAVIDGVPAERLDTDALRGVSTGPAGRTIRFTLVGGEERTLTAADFY